MQLAVDSQCSQSDWLIMQARLLLCHITRRVDEAKILSAATAAGFESLEPPKPDVEAAFPSGLFRLLCFCRTQQHMVSHDGVVSAA